MSKIYNGAYRALDPSRLHEVFSYDHVSGLLYWKKRKSGTDLLGRPVNKSAQARFNARHAGTHAFRAIGSNGYMYGVLFGVTCRAHQVVWALHNGCWASADIDHIDGNRLNNCAENLRCVDRTTNARNSSLRRDNTSGVVGVVWDKSRKRWVARIKRDGRYAALGRFERLEDAAAARKSAELALGYHANHGKSLDA